MHCTYTPWLHGHSEVILGGLLIFGNKNLHISCFPLTQVRGAPAIAIVGTLSVALELRHKQFSSANDLGKLKLFVHCKFEHLQTARPTAVNIAEEGRRFKERLAQLSAAIPNVPEVQRILLGEMEGVLAEDITKNRAIGRNGATEIISRIGSRAELGGKVSVLTHCNTGSLATGGYGTALGVIRSLHEVGLLQHVYCTETRPYNQGARLTAYELTHDSIPASLICDSMAALLMQQGKVSVVVVGADRIVANGDTANKIGTYQLAIAAKYHGIPFYVAAPMNTVDFSLQRGQEIIIEERPSEEMFYVQGRRVAAEGIGCWNPAFDVTPAALITGGIVTEIGTFSACSLPSIRSVASQ